MTLLALFSTLESHGSDHYLMTNVQLPQPAIVPERHNTGHNLIFLGRNLADISEQWATREEMPNANFFAMLCNIYQAFQVQLQTVHKMLGIDIVEAELLEEARQITSGDI